MNTTIKTNEDIVQTMGDYLRDCLMYGEPEDSAYETVIWNGLCLVEELHNLDTFWFPVDRTNLKQSYEDLKTRIINSDFTPS